MNQKLYLEEETNYKALLDSSKIMEEKHVGLFPISKRPKKLQERDHFAKDRAATLQDLGTHFTKNLLETDNKFLKSNHKDLILQGGAQPNHWEDAHNTSSPIPL